MSAIISVLSTETLFSRGFSDLYPLKKWSKDLREEGYTINFYTYHKSNNIFKCDILLLHHRYYEQINRGNYSPNGFQSSNKNFIINFIQQANKKGIKIILFDGGDDTGNRQTQLLPFVDIFLKKQIFKNKNKYINEQPYTNVQTWLPKSVYVSEKLKKLPPVHKEDLYKIQKGWNIGLSDYRLFPQLFRKFFPFSSSVIPSNVYSRASYSKPSDNRELLFSYRGNLRATNERYSYNRNKLFKVLHENKKIYSKKYNLGGKIPYNKYINELHNSRIGISPFGWGELCYRDFEIMISGSILVKPSVEHIDTYPNYFIKNETYIPTQWDYTDLREIISDIDKNYKNYIPIAEKAQDIFEYYNSSSREFIKHFKSIIQKL